MKSLALGAALALSAPIVFSACTASAPDARAGAELGAPLALTVITLESSPETDADPVRTWLDDLSSPRLSTLSGLDWECSGTPPTLQVRLSALHLDCNKLVLGQSELAASTELECLANNRLRVKHLRAGCGRAAGAQAPSTAEPATPFELRALHAGPDRGLLRRQNNRWIPNEALHSSIAGSLVPLRFGATERAQLRRPALRAWLGAAAGSGAVRLELTAIEGVAGTGAAASGALNALRSRIETLPPPKLFRPEPRWATPPATVGAQANSSRLGFVTLRHRYRDPLLAQACEYVDHWLKARQLQAGLRPTPDGASRAEAAGMAEFECQITWNDKPSSTASLTLTYLPLPLVVAESGAFPVRSSEEARSLAVLQGLKFLK